MNWDLSRVEAHFAAKFAEIDRQVDASSIDMAAVDKEIAEMLAARKLNPTAGPEPQPAAEPASDDTPARL
jgi:hypothetical protein